MERQARRFDLLIDTITVTYPMDPYLKALKVDGVLCSLGLPDRFEMTPMMLALGRRSVASSGAGGTDDTTATPAFCAEHAITADVEVIKPSDINNEAA